MKILVNGLSARLGGGQTYLLNLLRRVPEGWGVFLLCPDNLNLAGLPTRVTRVESQLKLDNPFRRAAWENASLGALAQRLEADLLFSPGGLLPAHLPKGLKTAVTFQNMLPFDHEQRKRYSLGYRRLRDWLLEHGLASAMRRADLVIFISRFAKAFIESTLGHLDGRSVIIPHGIAADFFPTAPLPLPPHAPKEPYFLYVSFIDYYKSQIEVVRAFAKVRAETKTTARLVLAGAANPPYEAVLKAEIARLRLHDAVCLAGNLPHRDLPALYQHALINLFASCTENCPNILLEMMASGRPALVSERGPMPEFGGNTVTYFDPGNVEQLTERWLKLLARPEMGERLAAKARNCVSSMSWENTATASWQAMEGIL